MIIYKATNKINGKCYIGQTIYELKKRQAEHFHAAFVQNSQGHFHRALRKYGKNQFLWEIISTGNSFFDLNYKEESYIVFFNSLSPAGYNMETGGFNHSQCEETRKKISASMMGNKHGQHPCSDKTKQKIRESNSSRGCSFETRQKMSIKHIGMRQSDETKEKRRQLMLGRETPWQTGVKQSPERIAKRAEKIVAINKIKRYNKKMEKILHILNSLIK